MAYVRRDGRGAREFRAKELRASLFTQFDGSAWYSQGRTCVSVSINGPAAARVEDYRGGNVKVHVRHAAQPPLAGGADRILNFEENERRRREEAAVGQALTTCLEAAVRLEQYPRCVIEVHVNILHNDGSLLAVAVNALMCAILDAGISCRTTVAAVSISACAPVEVQTSSNNSEIHLNSAPFLLLDPTMAEETTDEAKSYATATFVLSKPIQIMNNSDNNNIMNNISCSSGGVLVTHMQQRPRSSEYNKCVNAKDLVGMVALAERAAGTLFEFFRNCNVPLE